MGNDVSEESIRLLLVDDHPAFRAGVHSFFDLNPKIEVVGQTDSWQDVLHLIDQTQPHVILLASSVLEDEFDRLLQIQASRHSPGIIIMVDKVDLPYIFELLSYGATGVTTQDVPADELNRMVECVFHKKRALSTTLVDALLTHFLEQDSSTLDCEAISIEALTSRERDVFGLVAQGLSNQEIAQQLSLSLSTVKSHVSNILSKLEVDNRAAVVRLALGRRSAGRKDETTQTNG